MKLTCIVLLLLLVLGAPIFAAPAVAAESNNNEVQLLPTTPGSALLRPGVRQNILVDAPSHKFFDTHNVVSMSVLTGLIAADGATTQHLIKDYKFREMNPIVRPLVTRGSGGQAAACAMGLGAAVGTSYLFHKTGRHRLEKWTLRLFIAGESAAVINNVVRTP